MDKIIHLKKGVTNFSSPIIANLNPGEVCKISGEGPGVSVMRCSCSPGIVIQFTQSGGWDGLKGAIVLENFSIMASGVRGTAVQITGQGGQASVAPTKEISSVLIHGEGPSSYWQTGISLYDVSFPRLENVKYQGILSGDFLGGDAIVISGHSSPTDILIHNFRAFLCSTAINVTGNTEGLVIDESLMLGCNTGLYWATDAGTPYFNLRGTHINSKFFGVFARQVNQAIITDNLIYQGIYGPPEHWVGIYLLGNGALNQINGNTIVGFDRELGENGIVLQQIYLSHVKNNIIHNVDTGIWLQDGTLRVSVEGNTIHKYRYLGVLDQGMENQVQFNNSYRNNEQPSIPT